MEESSVHVFVISLLKWLRHMILVQMSVQEMPLRLEYVSGMLVGILKLDTPFTGTVLSLAAACRAEAEICLRPLPDRPGMSLGDLSLAFTSVPYCKSVMGKRSQNNLKSSKK